jgi:hypothetical protein
VAYLPLLSSMMSSFGTSTEDEATFSRRVDAQTGGLGMGPQTMAVPGRAWTVGDRDDLSSYWMVSGNPNPNPSPNPQPLPQPPTLTPTPNPNPNADPNPNIPTR